MNLTKCSLVISSLPIQHQYWVSILRFPWTGTVQSHYHTLSLIKCEKPCVTWCSGPYLGPKWEKGIRRSNLRSLTQPCRHLSGLPFWWTLLMVTLYLKNRKGTTDLIHHSYPSPAVILTEDFSTKGVMPLWITTMLCSCGFQAQNLKSFTSAGGKHCWPHCTNSELRHRKLNYPKVTEWISSRCRTRSHLHSLPNSMPPTTHSKEVIKCKSITELTKNFLHADCSEVTLRESNDKREGA